MSYDDFVFIEVYAADSFQEILNSDHVVNKCIDDFRL